MIGPPGPTPTNGIAFFDLDLTLLAVNSARLWVRHEVDQGRVGRADAVRAAAWMGLYHAGFARLERAIRGAVRMLEGVEEAPYRERVHRFWDEALAPTLRPGGLATIAAHRARGDAVYLLSSTSPYLAEKAVAACALDGYLCNAFVVADGVLTGEAADPLCFGAGKLHYARATAEVRGVDLSQCAFYTDSMSDLPVLEAVGAPAAVHPDPRLKRAARRRGWPVLDWSALDDR